VREFNLLEGIEKAEEEFFDTCLRRVSDKLKAARRALILLLMIREPLGRSEKTDKPFDEVEQAFIELAAAVFANGRSAFLLVMKGYLLSAQILLRTLWEQIVLMGYFRLYPDECRVWALASADERAARTPSPLDAWGAIRAKGQVSVLGGGRGRGKVYEYLSRYAHMHRDALFDLTIQINDTMAATSFGPAYKPTNLDFVIELLVSELVSAMKILEKIFESRLHETGIQPLDELLIDILTLAGMLEPEEESR
jgi:hypothetical protein